MEKEIKQYIRLMQKKEAIEKEIAGIKEAIKKEMLKKKIDKTFVNGVQVFFQERKKYFFDVKGILKSAPEVIEKLSITNSNFMSLLDNHPEILKFRKILGGVKILVIKQEEK